MRHCSPETTAFIITVVVCSNSVFFPSHQNDLLAVKMKQEGEMAAQGLEIDDLNRRLEMGKLEYRTLMKKHQSLLHRQNMEEECTYPEGLATFFEGLAKLRVRA